MQSGAAGGSPVSASTAAFIPSGISQKIKFSWHLVNNGSLFVSNINSSALNAIGTIAANSTGTYAQGEFNLLTADTLWFSGASGTENNIYCRGFTVTKLG